MEKNLSQNWTYVKSNFKKTAVSKIFIITDLHNFKKFTSFKVEKFLSFEGRMEEVNSEGEKNYFIIRVDFNRKRQSKKIKRENIVD